MIYPEYTKELQKILLKVKHRYSDKEVERLYKKLEMKIIKENNINVGKHESLWFRFFPTDPAANGLNDLLNISRKSINNQLYIYKQIDIALKQTELPIYIS